MLKCTREQYEAALAALNLDPTTTVSLFLSPDWCRIEHTDQAATSVPVEPPAPPAGPAPAA